MTALLWDPGLCDSDVQSLKTDAALTVSAVIIAFDKDTEENTRLQEGVNDCQHLIIGN